MGRDGAGLHAAQVYGLPTLMVFKDGQEVPGSKREGAFTKPLLIKYLDKVGISK